MLARALLVSSLAAAAACGGTSAPVAPAPGNAPSAAPASTSFALEGVSWTIAAGGTVSADGEYGQKLTTPAFELSLMAWPRSEAFVQTAGQQLEATPGAQVLHQVDGGEYAFEIVLDTGGVVDGSVLVADPGGGDGVMCGFKLAAGADWHPALAACTSLARAGD